MSRFNTYKSTKMTTLKKQGLIFIAGLMGIILLGLFGRTPQPSASPDNSGLDLTEKQTQTSSCGGATQWTPHGPYVGPSGRKGLFRQ